MELSLVKLIGIILSYLIGSFSPSYFISKYIYGFDIRTRGSKNPGTTNALRTMGWGPALATLLIDFLKGFLPAVLARYFYGIEYGTICGFMTIVGHNYPFYLNFKGGKGVATSMGAFSPIYPSTAFISIGIGVIVLFITRTMSLASLTGFGVCVLVSILRIIAGDNVFINVLYIIVGLHGIIRHKSNIDRLMKGTESKIGETSEK